MLTVYEIHVRLITWMCSILEILSEQIKSHCFKSLNSSISSMCWYIMIPCSTIFSFDQTFIKFLPAQHASHTNIRPINQVSFPCFRNVLISVCVCLVGCCSWRVGFYSHSTVPSSLRHNIPFWHFPVSFSLSKISQTLSTMNTSA